MWVDINNRLPERNVKVCAYTDYDGFLPYMYLDDDNEWVSSCFIWSGRTVTHWMPIPEPPTSGNVEMSNLKHITSLDKQKDKISALLERLFDIAFTLPNNSELLEVIREVRKSI